GAGSPLPAAERGDVDRIAARAAAELGPGPYAERFREGAALDPEQALARLRVHVRLRAHVRRGEPHEAAGG
ncbi:hypothetical protein G3I40_00575, partial [Streptomyces sp. SID14478]|uniref:hypothetical protein n=1 Tax=Streptomyces sp. SID14478 TaxID=2706073 RepID=UPI0013D8EF1F